MKAAILNTSPANFSLLMTRQAENRSEPTPAESRMMNLLDAISERFTFERGVLTPARFYFVDFYLPKPRKLCIEVDGESHIGREAYDAEKDRYLREIRKMRVLRVTNKQVFEITPEELRDKINEVAPLRGPGGIART